MFVCHEAVLDILLMRAVTSRILFFCPSLTLPARQQWARAFWMMCLFDLALGSLYNFGPEWKTKHWDVVMETLFGENSPPNFYSPVLICAEEKHKPVYSVLDVTEEVVDPFSQSFSPFLLLERLGDRKPSAESGLENTCKHIPQIIISTSCSECMKSQLSAAAEQTFHGSPFTFRL